MKTKIFLPILLFVAFCLSATAQYNPGKGKTLLLIGQTWQQEFQNYVNAVKPPAGSSHYGEIYKGEINQGDDAFGNNFLTYVNNTYPGAYALVAISIKDNPGAGGYGNTYSALKDIAAGKWDAQIDQFAQTFAAHSDLKFFVRLGYEVSLYMFASGGDSQTYKDAYNRMARRIKAIAGNVEFVYHPVRGFNDVVDLYPGDEYVDWVALSVFNHDVCLSSPSGSNCSGKIDGNLEKAFDWAVNTKHKPVMIAESAVQRYASETPEGFIDYLNRVRDIIDTYDVGVWAYINSDWNAHNWTGDWGDSRVEANSTVLKHWNSIVNTSRYVHYGDNIAPTCNDGIQNGDEEGIDCGGSCPDKCDTTVVPTCDDGIQNGDEEGIDCGGSCPDICTEPGTCGVFGVTYVNDNTVKVYHKDEGWTGEWNYVCLNGVCYPGTVTEGYYQREFSATLGNQYTIQFKVQDNATGQYLSPVETVEFTKDQCTFITYPEPTCDDGIMNGDETHIDCGGSCPSEGCCLDENGIAVRCRELKSATGQIEVLEKTSKLMVKPVPASDYINLIGIDGSVSYSIYNISGQQMLSGKGNVVDIANLESGVYILKTETNERVRFIKK